MEKTPTPKFLSKSNLKRLLRVGQIISDGYNTATIDTEGNNGSNECNRLDHIRPPS